MINDVCVRATTSLERECIDGHAEQQVVWCGRSCQSCGFSQVDGADGFRSQA